MCSSTFHAVVPLVGIRAGVPGDWHPYRDRHLARACQRRIRLEAMEQGLALRYVGTLLGVPRIVSAIGLGSRTSASGPITLGVKCAGARSAGNPHATCDVAGAGNGATATPKRARREISDTSQGET